MINRTEFFSDLTVLITSSLSLFEMNQVNLLSALTAPHSLIFLSNLSNVDEVDSIAYLDKTSLATGTAWCISAFLLKLPIILPNVLPRNLPDWII